MTVDIYRPPARLGRRLPLWVTLAALWGTTAVVLWVVIGLLRQRIPSEFSFLLPTAIVVGTAVVNFYILNPRRRSVDQVLSADGFPHWGDEDSVRPADREERAAGRRLRRGAITRREYERIIARRRFVHGEISRAEYHKLIQQLAEEEPTQQAGNSPSNGQP